MEKSNKKHQQRKRLSGEGLSTWHYGSKQKDNGKNSVAIVNEVGARFATSPNQEDAKILLDYFHSYIMKYVGLLTTGKLSDHSGKISSDTKKFISLFTPRQEGRGKFNISQMKQAAERLPNAFINMTTDDVYNELITIFFELAKRFNPEIGGFTGYIGHHFKFAVKQKMFQVQRDPMNFISLYNGIESQDENLIDYSLTETNDLNESEKLHTDIQLPIEPLDFPHLDFSFISSPPVPFDVLWSRTQRAVIVYRYFQDYSFNQISDQLGLGSAANAREFHDKAIESFRHWAQINLGD